MSGGNLEDWLGAAGFDPILGLQMKANMLTRALVEVLQEDHGGEYVLEEGLIERSMSDDLCLELNTEPDGSISVRVVPTPDEHRQDTGTASIPGAVCCGDLYDHAPNDDAPLRRYLVDRVDEYDNAHLKSSTGIVVKVPTTTLLDHEDGWRRAANHHL